MSLAVTWYSLWDKASADAGITLKKGFNTAVNALIEMSRAEHELQVFTNAVRHTLTLAVSPITSPTGVYTADIDLKQPLTGQFLAAGGTQNIDVVPLTFDDMDDLQRRFVPVTLAANSQQLWWTFDQGNITIYPANVTGTFTAKYIPHMAAYDPNNLVGRFSTFTSNPSTAMKTNGPAREFGTAADAIGDRLFMWLCESVDGGIQKFEARYKRAMANWETAKRFNVKDLVQMNKRRQFPGRNGVVR